MSPKALLDKFANWFDALPSAEKYILVGLGLVAVLYLYTVLYFQPASGNIASLHRQLATVQERLGQQLSRAQELQQTGLEDPDKFIRERLADLLDEQAIVDSGIQELAGNLVSANGMTQMLTSVLDSQEGLLLIRVENSAPEALTNSLPAATVVQTTAAAAGDAVLQSIGFQVFRHGLVLEFQGSFFSTLRYLRFLETMDKSFFWDSVEYQQSTWPDARVTLRLHTLSSEEGFIGV